MDTKSEYWKGDQIFNVPQRHVCWRLVLHMSQSWEVMGPFKKDWKLEVFRSLGFLHLGQSQDPQSCPFPTWHEVRDFCLPVVPFLRCAASLHHRSKTMAPVSHGPEPPSPWVKTHLYRWSIPGMMRCNTKSQWKFCEAYFERVSVSVLICWEVFSWRFGEIKCLVRQLPFI